jgi:hypothetical protein
MQCRIAPIRANCSPGGRVNLRSARRGEDVRRYRWRARATASFAGQYEPYLDVPNDEVRDKVRLCWMSLFICIGDLIQVDGNCGRVILERGRCDG